MHGLNLCPSLCCSACRPIRHSLLDILPCLLPKSCAHVFTSTIARLANLSLQTGMFLARYKRVQLLPLLKKAGFDSTQPLNYRSISNLLTVSKVLERLALARQRPHLFSSANVSQFQSTYRKGHSTDCTTGGFERSFHGGRRQTSHCPDRPRPVGWLRHRRPPAPT